MKLLLVGTSAAALLFAATATAQGQEPGADAPVQADKEDAVAVLERVVVTAQKRAEDVQ